MVSRLRGALRRIVASPKTAPFARGPAGAARAGSGDDEALERVRRREQQLIEAQSIARIGSWEWQLDSDSLNWSDQLFRMFGVDQDTYRPTRERFLDLLHPDDREPARLAMLAAIDEGTGFAFDGRVPGADGSPPTWVRVRGTTVAGPDGRTSRLTGTVQDVTESKEHENALAFLSVMASAVNEADRLVDALVAANELVRPYAQWPALVVGVATDPDLEELEYVDVGWVDLDATERAAARDLASRVAAERTELVGHSPSGSTILGGPVLVQGRLACVLVVDTLATTEPRPHERTIFTQILALLRAVGEREFTSRELAAARDEALSASRAKSDFLATMSHEIRTPLNGVIGLSDLLGRTELTAHQRRLAQGVDQAGRTLLALVNDILDLSKIEAGRLDLEEVDFDPRTVVEHSAGLVAERAAEQGLELVVSCAADLPERVCGDPVRFGQVITNLASNAVKFTAEGEVVIRAEGQAGPHGSTVRVEVHDTGVGIDPATRERLFQPFTQADSSTTRRFGGTGLGLAISQRIVDAMGGEIDVDSEPGVGSTFWFTVAFDPPRTADAGDARERAHDREHAVAGLRVLVVDDNATNRYILTEQLAAWRVDVRAVASAYDALGEIEAARGHGLPYDLVLLDYMMPEVDGEELARTIRRDPSQEGVRLVLLSSAIEPSEGWLHDAGIDAFLAKPVLPSRLLDVVASLGGRLADAGERPERVVDIEPGSRGRLLVVEDNAVNQLVAEGVLRRLGYDVDLAEDGAQAVAAHARDPDAYAVILMDCQMPVMDGYDATRAIRAAQGEGRRVPIVAMTAAASSEERQRCLAAGMDDFLAKPIDVQRVAETLERWTAPRAPKQDGLDPVRAADPEGSARQAAGPDVATPRARLSELVEQEGIAADLVLRMVGRFESSARTAAAALATAAAARDPGAVARAAHGLKGSAANLGLADLSALAAGLEEGGRAGVLPADGDLAALVAAVDDGVAELLAAARAVLPGAAG
ncbi:hybrid sensor histidine kinase/response regulator [Nocardioides ferulae]|uniref:hybrid sensor histidine kinase/response regulator n=1 Tax=Nocardioides ferulae TaxID=2340821 RepID=UPI000EAD10B9|nr:response regulator [Nocardioides ferulae]